ncbi:Spy/CpxP family protein refolding chaperone [Thiomicrorhabdus sp.]|uniref:Spy/CpxP family protein refolding chaperone n=1 Tax=Thiomicrorhabdus sp. TaxID=2039724 RepID=UPI00356584BA
MKTSMKTLLITSIVSIATLSYAMADEPDDMPYQRGMMQGGPGYGMMGQGLGPGPGYGMGYGMMGQGYGPGPGYGPGYHMGPGYGMGYGPGYHMGPGYGMGYGMHPGYGMGYGMHPGYGMGPGYGMMGGMGPGYGMMGPGYGTGIKLSKDQQKSIDKIRKDLFKEQRNNMREMWQEQKRLGDLMTADKEDPKAIQEAYGRISNLQEKSFRKRMEMQKQMDGVLTDEQKKQMRQSYPYPRPMYDD